MLKPGMLTDKTASGSDTPGVFNKPDCYLFTNPFDLAVHKFSTHSVLHFGILDTRGTAITLHEYLFDFGEVFRLKSNLRSNELAFNKIHKKGCGDTIITRPGID